MRCLIKVIYCWWFVIIFPFGQPVNRNIRKKTLSLIHFQKYPFLLNKSKAKYFCPHQCFWFVYDDFWYCFFRSLCFYLSKQEMEHFQNNALSKGSIFLKPITNTSIFIRVFTHSSGDSRRKCIKKYACLFIQKC